MIIICQIKIDVLFSRDHDVKSLIRIRSRTLMGHVWEVKYSLLFALHEEVVLPNKDDMNDALGRAEVVD